MPTLKRLLAQSKDLTLVFAIVLILFVLFSPIPSPFLDLAILCNFGLGLTILLLTLYVAKPVEFSTFPSLLLISTLFRLSLNVAATRLILTDGNAGEVINSIGAFAVGGNFVVGLVVFFILVVVQYVVVTSGAQRVSEVAARFTLDSMPGHQMSIDADLNMGLIDQKEAIRRRAELEKEASFYGAMDGASKFVKGDAIAGVIILLINIIAGWIVGIVQMQMSWDQALEHFTLLTIGDGIATQLPALIISIATGIIVTRSASDRELSTEILKQFSSSPRIPLIVAGILSLLLLLPGMPKWPLVLLLGGALLAWAHIRRRTKSDAERIESEASDISSAEAASSQSVSVALGPKLSQAWRTKETQIMERVANLRDASEQALGFSFPPLKLIDGHALAPNDYEIRLFGARYAYGQIEPDCILAIRGEAAMHRLDGIETVEPAFGLPAVWIPEARSSTPEKGYTYVDPITVFITHMSEVLRTESATLLTRAAVTARLDEARARQPGLVEELTPTLLSVSDVQRVLQNLLSENVSIASFDLILEHLVDLARTERDPGALTELLRPRLGYLICNALRDRHRDLAVMSLDPRLENQIQSSLAASAKRDLLLLDPKLAERLLRRIHDTAQDMTRHGREPVLLCGADIRRPLKALTRRTLPRLAVVSIAEIPLQIDLSSHAVLRVDPTDAPSAARAPERASNSEPGILHAS
jgi:flagellar biosynthesis protein FlhA